MPIRLIDADTVPPVRSQTVYHAVAYAMTPETPNTIILVAPDAPYVCIGFHQEVDKEVNVDFCREHGLPVVRREVGGGAVYLDSNQVFTQWVFHEEDLPMQVEKRFRLHAEPLVKTYRALDIPAEFHPVNDVQVRGRKIGGMGAAAIGNAEVLVCSLMFDFNFELMARVLKVPDEKFRNKIYQSLQEYMTTLTRELGAAPGKEMVKELYIRECQTLFDDELIPGEFTDPELREMEKLDAKFSSRSWLDEKGGLVRPAVKIHADVWVGETAYKAPGGLIRATVRIRKNRIDDISFSGDFTLYPQDQLRVLEQILLHQPIENEALMDAARKFYEENDVQSPGIEPEDWVNAIADLGASVLRSG